MEKIMKKVLGEKTKLFVFLMILVCVANLFAKGAQSTQPNALGDVIDVRVEENFIDLIIKSNKDKNDRLTINICDDNIVKVNYFPKSIEASPDTPMIDPNLSWEDDVESNISHDENTINIKTSSMSIVISKTPYRMTVKKADDTVLFWEPPEGGICDDGVRFVRAESSNMYGISSYDCFTGAGELLRNNSKIPAQSGQQGNSGGPFFWSTEGYGLLIDADGGYPYIDADTKKMEFYYGDPTEQGRRYKKDDVECYIILGSPTDILQGFSKITGTSPMMPKWSLGFSNFEWNINEKELVEYIELYRAKNIPIDSYALDYDWKNYGEDNYGEFRWNEENFPSAKETALKEDMQKKGINLIGITKPRIVTKLEGNVQTVQGKYAEENNLFYPGHYEYKDYFMPVTVQSIDPYNPEQRSWWWENSEDAFDRGIVGWWNDETDKVSANNASFWFGNFTTLHISQSLFEGQKKYTDNQTRVWQTARNYYPGTQRYATSLWSGDIATQFYKGERVDWAVGLEEQKVSLLSTINNGQPKWGTDGGGFNQNDKKFENPSPELYARWVQLSSMTPVFRVHGTNYHQRQPWVFGYTAEEVAKSAIHLRYSLLPYLYAYERQAYDTGVGLVRPLLFDYPEDDSVANYSDAWMFGDYFLVAPITQRDQNVKWIYLPEGTWIDYNRGTTYTGGKYISYSLNDETWTDLPMFIKEGAIIPTQKVLDYISQEKVSEIFFDIFPSSQKNSFTYYDDDGATYNYENGEFFSQNISSIKNDDTIEITIAPKEGSYSPNVAFYYLAIQGTASNKVESNGSEITSLKDYTALKSSSTVSWCVGRDIYGSVTYVKVPAQNTKSITITATGQQDISIDSQLYEAEESSLSANELQAKPQINQKGEGYSGTGFVENFTASGAAVTFYAKVSNPGEYPLTIGYSNGNTTSKIVSVYINSLYSGKLHMNPTNNWSDWAESIFTANLVSGNNIITLKYDERTGDTGAVNLDYLKIPFEPNQIILQAESASLHDAKVNQDHWFYQGSGFVEVTNKVGSKTDFYIESAQPDNYSLGLRYANATSQVQTMSLYVNDHKIKTLQIPISGTDWNEWNTLQHKIDLPMGANVISYRIDEGDTGLVNLDQLSIKPETLPTQKINLLDNGNFERSTRYNSNWNQWHPEGQTSAFGIDSGSNTAVPDSPIEGDQSAYFYLKDAYKQSIKQSVNVDNGSYTVQAWVRVTNTTPSTSRIEITNYGGNDIYANMPEANSQWELVTIDTIQVTNGTIDIAFFCDSKGGTTIHIDDVRLIAN